MIAPRQINPEQFTRDADGHDVAYRREFVAGGTITRFAVVYVSGTNGTYLDTRETVVAASAAAVGTCTPDLWIALNAASSGDKVVCVKEYMVGSTNTNSATAALHPWYLTTAGAGAAAPTAAHSAVAIGYVVYKDATNGVVHLCPDRVSQILGAQPVRVIADPGNAGAIDVRFSSFVKLVSAAAETRTLAVPKFVGQEVTLYMDTDGGDIVITASQAINAAGNTIMTFDTARDNITLKGVTVGGALRWEVFVNNAVALS